MKAEALAHSAQISQNRGAHGFLRIGADSLGGMMLNLGAFSLIRDSERWIVQPGAECLGFIK